MTVAGLGFATPYLGAFRGESHCVAALMPAEQGALVWPHASNSQSVMVDETALPLADNALDRLLVVHCLEAATDPRQLLREMWRVLKPDGRVILIVPNRRGVWSRREATPFGHGRPYSRGQLETLLVEAMFTPLDWSGALHLPPVSQRGVLKWSMAAERIGSRLWPAFSGVILVEATKEMIQPIGIGAKAGARKPVMVPVVRGEPARGRKGE
jgi:SAM-dependent methyltransferase